MAFHTCSQDVHWDTLLARDCPQMTSPQISRHEDFTPKGSGTAVVMIIPDFNLPSRHLVGNVSMHHCCTFVTITNWTRNFFYTMSAFMWKVTTLKEQAFLKKQDFFPSLLRLGLECEVFTQSMNCPVISFNMVVDGIHVFMREKAERAVFACWLGSQTT